jgi:hypothetical protein
MQDGVALGLSAAAVICRLPTLHSWHDGVVFSCRTSTLSYQNEIVTSCTCIGAI